MKKGKILAGLLLFSLFVSIGFVSASSYVDERFVQNSRNYDKWTYWEDLKGSHRGYVMLHEWSTPSYRYNREAQEFDPYYSDDRPSYYTDNRRDYYRDDRSRTFGSYNRRPFSYGSSDYR